MNEICKSYYEDLLKVGAEAELLSFEKTKEYFLKMYEIWHVETNHKDELLEAILYQIALTFPDAVSLSELEMALVRREMNSWMNCYYLLTQRLIMAPECDEELHEKLNEMNKVPGFCEICCTIIGCYVMLNILDMSPNITGQDFHQIMLTNFGYECKTKKTEFRDFVEFILSSAVKSKLCRMNNKIYTPVLYKGNPTYAWKFDCTMEQWVRRQCTKENPEGFELSLHHASFVPLVIKYMENYVGAHVNEIKRDPNVFSFRNGVYFAKFDKFIPFSDKLVYYPGTFKCPIAAHFFDEDFNEYPDFVDEKAFKIPTPEIDKILNYQEFSSHGQMQLWALIGRCLYNINETHDFPENNMYNIIEKWEVALCLYGIKNTGKSQIIHMIRQFYHEDDVGVMENKMREIQGLEGLQDAFVVIAPDLKNDFFLDRTTFQKIVEGTDVVVQGMYKKGEKVTWKRQVVFGFNENPYQDDPQASVARRQAIVRFHKKVESKDIDPSIQKKIENNVGPHLLKANRLFRYFVRTSVGRVFWDFAAPMFTTARASMEAETNPWTSFIQSERVILNENFYVPFSKVREEFNNFKSFLPRKQQLQTGCSEHHYFNTFAEFKLDVETIKKEDRIYYPPEESFYIHPGMETKRLRAGLKIIKGMDIVDGFIENEEEQPNKRLKVTSLISSSTDN